MRPSRRSGRFGAVADDADDGDCGADGLEQVKERAQGPRVRELRPLFTPPDPASRTDSQFGELAQYDLWFPPVEVPLGLEQAEQPPVPIMVSGYSRVITARMIPSRQSRICRPDIGR